MSWRIWICGLALVLVAVAGVALAEGGIPGPDGVINACRKIEGGRLRAVPSVARCRSYERPLRWNVRGPVGPAGPPGPAGPQGEPGPGLASFDALGGLPCTLGSRSGTIAIGYDAASGDAHIRCVLPAPPSAPVRINEIPTTRVTMRVRGADANEKLTRARLQSRRCSARPERTFEALVRKREPMRKGPGTRNRADDDRA